MLCTRKKATKCDNGIMLPKLFWPNCFSDAEKLLRFEAEGRGFAKNLRALKQFIQAVKGQTIFGKGTL